jgi:hypothetical protein
VALVLVGQSFPTLGPAVGKNLTAIPCGHPLAEAVLFLSVDFLRLVCSFQRELSFLNAVDSMIYSNVTLNYYIVSVYAVSILFFAICRRPPLHFRNSLQNGVITLNNTT